MTGRRATSTTSRSARVVGAALCVAVWCAVFAAPIIAQGPPPGLAPGEAWSDAAVAESLKVLAQLDDAVRSKQRDAALWYRRGMISWGLMYRARVGPAYKGLDWTLLGRKADTSMRLAYQLDSKNPRHVLSLGQFMLGAGTMATRAQSYLLFGKALDAARKSPDKEFLAETLIEAGRVSWRRYDALANRRMGGLDDSVLRSLSMPSDRAAEAGRPTNSLSPATGATPVAAKDVIDRVNMHTTPLPPDLMGAGDYEKAEALFREAYQATPTSERAFRQLAMVLAEKRRWVELASHARAHVVRVPRDGKAWMALGLALQRSRGTAAARAAFDSAQAMLNLKERSSLNSLVRVISPSSTGGYNTMTENERLREERAYWLFNDPLWSRGGDDARTEYFARAAFAEIRWTVEELGVRGLDSDRGEFHVRFGPPTVEVALGPAPNRGELGGALGDSVAEFAGKSESIVAQTWNSPIPLAGSTDADAMANTSERAAQISNLTTLWAYNTGMLIVFRGLPTYGTAKIPPADQAIVDSIVRATPAQWANVAEEKIEDMPTQIARFRATRDSIDVFVATEPPVKRMQQESAGNALVHTHLWLFGREIADAFRDSASASEPGVRAWAYRVRPATYAYRIETTVDGAMLAGRSTEWIDATATAKTGFPRQGFGISDLLLASSVEEKAGAKRWDDLDIEAIGGSIPKDGAVELVWENYEFGQKDGAANYGVVITIQHKHTDAVNRIRARIVGALAAAVGIEQTEDKILMRFERTRPHGPVVVDHVALNMADSPPGDYLLTLTVTDRATGQTAERQQRLIIRAQ